MQQGKNRKQTKVWTVYRNLAKGMDNNLQYRNGKVLTIRLENRQKINNNEAVH